VEQLSQTSDPDKQFKRLINHYSKHIGRVRYYRQMAAILLDLGLESKLVAGRARLIDIAFIVAQKRSSSVTRYSRSDVPNKSQAAPR